MPVLQLSEDGDYVVIIYYEGQNIVRLRIFETEFFLSRLNMMDQEFHAIIQSVQNS